MVNVTTIDRQGRLVVPASERRRLGLDADREVRLSPTAEGLLLEPVVDVTVEVGPDGLATATIAGGTEIANDEVVAALHADRDGRS